MKHSPTFWGLGILVSSLLAHPSAATVSARLVSAECPKIILTNEEMAVTVVVRNTGTEQFIGRCFLSDFSWYPLWSVSPLETALDIIPGGSVTQTITFTTAHLPETTGHYKFTVNAISGLPNIAHVTNSPRWVNFTISPVAAAKKHDFDGDGTADLAIYRANGNFSCRSLVAGSLGSDYFGPLTAFNTYPVAADFEGAGRMQRLIYNGYWAGFKSNWVFLPSHVSRYSYGAWTDVPVPGDFDGDRFADVAVFQLLTGKIKFKESASRKSFTTWIGDPSWIPAIADFDGDQVDDLAWFVPSSGSWRILLSSLGRRESKNRPVLGQSGDFPMPADYDGDGRADPAVFRSSDGKIRVLQSGSRTLWTSKKGYLDGWPVVADYDGDNRADPAWFIPATHEWCILMSGSGHQERLPHPSFGSSLDIPLATPVMFWAYTGGGHVSLVDESSTFSITHVTVKNTSSQQIVYSGGAFSSRQLPSGAYEMTVGYYGKNGIWYARGDNHLTFAVRRGSNLSYAMRGGSFDPPWYDPPSLVLK